MGASVVELSIDLSTTAGGRMTDITEENIQATRDYALPTFNLTCNQFWAIIFIFWMHLICKYEMDRREWNEKTRRRKKLSHLEITHSYGNVVSKYFRMVVEGQSRHATMYK